jgi:hypothetical protein
VLRAEAAVVLVKSLAMVIFPFVPDLLSVAGGEPSLATLSI